MSTNTDAIKQIADNAHALALVAWRHDDRPLAKAWSNIALKLGRVLDLYETAEMVQESVDRRRARGRLRGQ